MKVTFFKSASLLMVILVFSLPFVSLAENMPEVADEIAAARAAAERDAVADVSGISLAFWFTCGAVLGPVPMLLAGFEKPSPPVMRLAGKSANYIAAYTYFYRTKVLRRKVIASAAGLLTSVMLLYVLLTPAA